VCGIPKEQRIDFRPLQVGLCARTSAQRCYLKGGWCTPIKMATKKAEQRIGSRRSEPSRTQACSRVLKIDPRSHGDLTLSFVPFLSSSSELSRACVFRALYDFNAFATAASIRNHFVSLIPYLFYALSPAIFDAITTTQIVLATGGSRTSVCFKYVARLPFDYQSLQCPFLPVFLFFDC